MARVSAKQQQVSIQCPADGDFAPEGTHSTSRLKQAAHNELKLQAQLAQPQLHQKLSARPPDFWMPLGVVVWRLRLTGLTRLVRLSS